MQGTATPPQTWPHRGKILQLLIHIPVHHHHHPAFSFLLSIFLLTGDREEEVEEEEVEVEVEVEVEEVGGCRTDLCVGGEVRRGAGTGLISQFR